MGVIITLTQWWVGLSIFGAIVLGTVITTIFSQKIVDLQMTQEGNEASFRKNLDGLHFYLIKKMFNKINNQLKVLSFMQKGFGQAFVLLPFIVLLPLYIGKVVTMGAFMQAVNALSKVVDSLTVLLDNRQTIIGIQSSINRIKLLNKGKK